MITQRTIQSPIQEAQVAGSGRDEHFRVFGHAPVLCRIARDNLTIPLIRGVATVAQAAGLIWVGGK
jgi:hypothetical protein